MYVCIPSTYTYKCICVCVFYMFCYSKRTLTNTSWVAEFELHQSDDAARAAGEVMTEQMPSLGHHHP